MLLSEKFFSWQEDYQPSRYVLACSGGRDSMALLYSLYLQRTSILPPIEVLYINHGWHIAAAEWGDWVLAQAKKLGFAGYMVTLAKDIVHTEDAARKARYSALCVHLPKKGVLLTAHHQWDQAETFLINLLRGSGLEGLSAMTLRRKFGAGEHWRPLLDVSRQQLDDFLTIHSIDWIEDPSNTDTRMQRNWIRQILLPTMQQRNPMIHRNLAQTAQWLRDTLELQQDNLDSILGPDNLLTLDRLQSVPISQGRLLVRRWLQRKGLLMPPAKRLQTWLLQILKHGGHAVMEYGDSCVFHYDQHLYVISRQLPSPPPCFTSETNWNGIGKLVVQHLPRVLQKRKLKWRLYPPGSAFRPIGQNHHKTLKEWWRIARVPPLLRRRTPLLYADEELIWVGDLGACAEIPDILIIWCK